MSPDRNDPPAGAGGDASGRAWFWRAAEATSRLRAHPWLGDVVALAVTALALFLRFAIDDVLPPGFPYLTFFPAVILTTFFCGLRPGILCAGLCGLAAWYFFLDPARPFALNGPTSLALALYAFIVSVDIALIHVMHVSAARVRAERTVSAGLYEQQRTMFQELQHRVANNMQFVAALLTLQKRSIESEPDAALRILDEARVRLETVSRIHRRLYDPERIALPIGDYLQTLCDDVLSATGVAGVICRVEAEPVTLDLTRLTTLSLLVVELVTNAFKHAFPHARGTVTISLLRKEPDRLVLTVADDGPGIPAGYDPATSRSLGMRISQGLATQLGGRLTYDAGPGATARLEFPAGA